MKLELKYLAPYLPYRLNVEIKRLKYPIQSEFVELTVNNIHQIKNTKLWQFKPILRPMSDLKKDINHKGEKITPIYWLEEQYFNLDLHEQAKELIKDPRWVNQSDYMLICHLIEWHFDVFGLIEKGLAIDINTIKQE